MTYALMVAVAGLWLASCSPKIHQDRMAAKNQPAPTAAPANDVAMVAFTKSRKQQLERNNADIRQLQFYIDQQIILRKMGGSSREIVKGGAIVSENNHTANEIVIPAMTPVVCDRVSEDTLMISFETPGNDIPFGALYGSNTFSILGSNWINGSADITYNNETYRVICGSCGNVAEVKLMVKETTVDKPSNTNKTIVGRKIYK